MILHTSCPTSLFAATSVVETQPAKTQIMSTVCQKGFQLHCSMYFFVLHSAVALSTCLVMFLTPFGNNTGSWSASMESISSRPMVCSRTGNVLAKEMFGVSTNGFLCFHNNVVEFAIIEELSGLLWLLLVSRKWSRRRIGKLKRNVMPITPLTNFPILGE